MDNETSNESNKNALTSAGTSKKRYPYLGAFLSERIEFIYSTQTNMMRIVGFNTRQAINERLAAACHRATTHDWWEAVLLLPRGSLAEIGTTEKKAAEASAKYNKVSYYKGPIRASIIKAVAQAIGAAVSPWDIAIRKERMNRKAAERTRLLNEARKLRSDIYGF